MTGQFPEGMTSAELLGTESDDHQRWEPGSLTPVCPLDQIPNVDNRIIASDCTKPNVLKEALAMVEGPRAEDYGPPEVNWARTSRIAIALTELDCLTPEVCVKVATAMKWARLLQTPDHHDTLVDIPGYGWVLSRVVEQ